MTGSFIHGIRAFCGKLKYKLFFIRRGLKIIDIYIFYNFIFNIKSFFLSRMFVINVYFSANSYLFPANFGSSSLKLNFRHKLNFSLKKIKITLDSHHFIYFYDYYSTLFACKKAAEPQLKLQKVDKKRSEAAKRLIFIFITVIRIKPEQDFII